MPDPTEDAAICDLLEDLMSRILARTKPRVKTPAIAVTANPTAVTVDVGSTVDVALSLTRVNFNGDVTPSITGLPAGVTGAFTPATLTSAQGFTTLTLTCAPGSTPVSNDAFTVTMTGSGVSDATVALTVTINDPTPASISVSANTLTNTVQQGGTCTFTFTLSRTNYTGTVTPAAGSLSSGISAAFSDSSLTGSDAITVMTLTATGGATTVTNDPITVTFSGSGVSDIVINATLTVTAVGAGDPDPDSGTPLIDTRSGKGGDIQVCTTWLQARNALRSMCRVVNSGAGGYCEFIGGTGLAPGNQGGSYRLNNGTGDIGWNWTTDVDGTGTRAFRLDRRGWADNGPNYLPTVGDNNYSIVPSIPLVSGSAPKEIYVQWKHRMGRTVTGGGYDDTAQVNGVDRSSVVGRFAITNEDHVPSNASRKWILANRPGSGQFRLDLIWAGDWTTTVGQSRSCHIECSSPVQNPSPGMLNISNATWNPKSVINQNFTFTVRFKAESTNGAADGLIQVWVDGVKLGERLNWAIGAAGFDRVELPNIINSPQYTQTEYMWDFVLWVP